MPSPDVPATQAYSKNLLHDEGHGFVLRCKLSTSFAQVTMVLSRQEIVHCHFFQMCPRCFAGSPAALTYEEDGKALYGVPGPGAYVAPSAFR